MLIAGWSFTNLCNLRCKHCYNASGKQKADELTLEESIKVADKLKEAWVTAVNFGGGECALRPDFIELCKYLKKIGIGISYTTNGTTYNVIEKHLNLFHDIGVSIDFADKEKHDAFRGRAGTFDKAILTLKKLVANNVDTEIVTCLTKLNCSEGELLKIYNLAKKLGVNYWRINRFRPNGRGICNEDILALSQEDLKKAYEFLSRYIPKDSSVPEPIFRAAFGGDYCLVGDPSGQTSFRIQANGEVSPSVFLKESGGNIKEKSIGEIMNSKIFQEIRTRSQNGKCKNCPAYFNCQGGDAGASYLQYKHFNGPDPMCWLKPEEINIKSKRIIGKSWNVHELYLCTLYIPIWRIKNGN